jgi:protein-disulfide isomerase
LSVIPDQQVLGAAIGVDAPMFESCLAGEATSQVASDIASGQDLSIRGTPAFVFGHVQEDSTIRVTRIQTGVPRIETLQPLIDDMLRVRVTSQ